MTGIFLLFFVSGLSVLSLAVKFAILAKLVAVMSILGPLVKISFT